MGAMVNLAIGITVAFLPLFMKVSTVDIARTTRDNFLVVIMMLLCFLLPNKVRSLPRILYVALAYGLFSLVFNQFNSAATIVMFQMFYAAIGMIFFCAYYEKHVEIGQKYIIDGMAIGCLIQSIVVIAAFFKIPLWFYWIKLFYPEVQGTRTIWPGIGTLGNPNLMGSYVALTAFGLFRPNRYWLLFIPITALLIGQSIMGIIALIAGAAYFYNQELNLVKKSWIYIGSIAFMIGAYFTGLNGMDSQRFFGWSENFKRVDFWHFLIGKGPGWFASHGIFLNPGELMTQEHNAFLTVFNMFGIIGILLLAPTFVKFIFTKDKNKIFSSVLFAAFINSYGHFTLHQSTVAIIIIVAGAICLAEGNKNGVHMER